MHGVIEGVIRDPDLEWLDHVRPTGLVLSPTVIKERTLVPERQTQTDSAQVEEVLPEDEGPALTNPWAFVETVFGWDARFVAGAPGGPTLPDNLTIKVPEHDTALAPEWAVQGFDGDAPWQLLVRLEPTGVDPDKRGAVEGWEATPQQRFERLLRETGVLAGVMISDRELRLVYAPRGETSGWLAFPLRSLATVAGRPMLAGLKLILGAFRLFNAAAEQRLRALLKRSREAQAAVSTALAEQVLGALHELLRGFHTAEPEAMGDLARRDPHHLYEGLLTVLMRLVFVLYAEDRDLIPSRSDALARKLYDDGYSVRGLYAKLTEDAALNPDTMDERFGGWGRLLALFRLIHKGHASGFVIGRRGKLFDPDVFPFLEGRDDASEPPRVAKLTDAVIGNPPFMGGRRMKSALSETYQDWLDAIQQGSRNADLVARFFRQSFSLLRQGGCLGLIATNTLRQGDTRATGLRPIRQAGGTIINAQRRIKWPGEAAVVISTVHIHKGPIGGPYVLDGREIDRITAYLFHAGGDADPAPLAANAGKSFQGSIVLGMGFTFDDTDTRGVASPTAEMHRLIAKDKRNAERIFPYMGGEEINTSPTHAHHRYVINFEDFPRERADLGTLWCDADDRQQRDWLRDGIVPLDYPDPVAADWPDLLAILQDRVKPERTRKKPSGDYQLRYPLFLRWWHHADKRPALYEAIAPLDRVLAISRVTEKAGIAFLASDTVFSEQLVVFALRTNAAFATLQCRVHEVWARFFASSLAETLRYAPSDCFETFPFPEGFATDPLLEAAGVAYYRHRAELMVRRDKGLTKTYNLFHDRLVRDDDIRTLRDLHAEMDRACLRAYGWDDLAARAESVFLDETNEDEFAYQGRLFWPSEVRDEVLARLLALNAERHAAELRAGLAPATASAAPDDAQAFAEDELL